MAGRDSNSTAGSNFYFRQNAELKQYLYALTACVRARSLQKQHTGQPIPRSRQSCEPSPSLPAKAKAARNPNPSPPLGFSKLMNARVVSQRDGKSAKMKRPKPCESSDAPLPPPVRRETKQPRDRDGGRDGSGEAKSDPPLRLAKLPKVAGCVKSVSRLLLGEGCWFWFAIGAEGSCLGSRLLLTHGSWFSLAIGGRVAILACCWWRDLGPRLLLADWPRF